MRAVNLFPRSIENSAARMTGADLKAGVFTRFSHLGLMLFARPTHPIGHNDYCD